MNETVRQFLIDGERMGMRYSLGVPRSTASAMTGLQLGQRAGSSLEFRDHRDYQPGDDLRRIDWSAYGRSDKLTVKLYRDEISPHLDIVLDGSRSMALEKSEKLQAATGLAAVLAVASENSGYSHNTWLLSDQCAPVVNGNDRPSVWSGVEFDFRGDPARGLTRTPPKFRRQGMRALISDLLWLDEPLRVLQSLAQGATSVIIVQLLAEADLNPRERGRVRLIDSETAEQRELLIDDAVIRRYREAFARHQLNWMRACRYAGAVMVSLTAEQITGDWNLQELVEARVLSV
jgi:uncharacterized protein (DUF58 family)